MGFYMRGIDHLHVGGSPIPSKLPEQAFPNAAPRPTHKAIIDRCRSTIFGRAIAPATATFQNLYNAADHPAIIDTLNASNVCRQVRFNLSPLLIAEPKQRSAHDPNPFQKRIRIVLSEGRN
jgi:hypothetical protein